MHWVKAQFRGLNLPTNQVAISDKVNPNVVFKSANGKITSICIFRKYIYVESVVKVQFRGLIRWCYVK